MGIVICDIHGPQGFVECCTHIYAKYEKRIVPSMFDVSPINLKVCQTCYLDFECHTLPNLTPDDLVKLSNEEGKVLEKQFLPKYDAIARRIFCIACLNELKEDQ